MEEIFDILAQDITLTDPAQDSPVDEAGLRRIKARTMARIRGGQIQVVPVRKKKRKWAVLLAAAVVTAGILIMTMSFGASAEPYVSPEKKIENELMQEYCDRLEAEYQIILKQKEEGDPDFEGKDWMSEPQLKDIASKHVEKQFRDEIHQMVKQHGRAEYIDEFKEYHDFDSIEDYDKFFLFILDCCDLYNSDELDLVEKVKLLYYIDMAYSHSTTGFSNGTGNGFNKDHVAVWNPEAHQHWVDAMRSSIDILKKTGKR